MKPFYGNSECADCGKPLLNHCYWVPVNKDDEGEGSEKAICPECYCGIYPVLGGSKSGWSLQGCGVPPPASRQLKHEMNCGAGYNSHGDEINGEDCRCGLRYRIQLQTEQTMHAAWRKRAEEAELENASLQWTPITESNLPDIGDEVLELPNATHGARVIPVGFAARPGDCERYTHAGFSHRRPINAPSAGQEEPSK